MRGSWRVTRRLFSEFDGCSRFPTLGLLERELEDLGRLSAALLGLLEGEAAFRSNDFASLVDGEAGFDGETPTSYLLAAVGLRDLFGSLGSG